MAIQILAHEQIVQWNRELREQKQKADTFLRQLSIQSPINASIPELVTITFLVALDGVESIDIAKVHNSLNRKAFGHRSDGDFTLRLNTTADRDGTVSRQRFVENCFYNQVSMTLTTVDGRAANCKVFQKGCLHVIGCLLVSELYNVATCIIELLYQECKEAFSLKDRGLQIGVAKPVMINSTTQILKGGKAVTLMPYKLLEFVADSGLGIKDKVNGLSLQYDHVTYAGLKIRYKGATALVFASGNIILTGCQSLGQMFELWSFLLSCILTKESSESILSTDAQNVAGCKRRKLRKDKKRAIQDR
jgi:hypothetical protein